jgi:hypothetical protein
MAGPGEFRVHDLADPISWLPDGCVDLILSRLHYWLAPLQATCEEIYQAGFFIERLLVAFRLVPRPV